MASSSGQEHCLRFSLAEIKSATNKFSDENVIGKGGFGKVYKGCLIKNSALVAVKRLDKSSEQGPSEFATEIETLSKIRHRNIVSLIGYCNDKREMIVVYEFIANLTLADHLHKRSINGLPSLTWNERLRILIGAARGLDHLHHGCPGISIIHRDVKSSNILLDEDLVAKVSDFGLAKPLSVDKSHVFASFKGSFGYLDPSFASSGGRLSKETDTYAFGVVMLEVLSGRLAFDKSRADDEWLLSVWASKREAHEIVASDVSGNIMSEGSLHLCLELAQRCLDKDLKNRPSMTHVVAQLESALQGLEPHPAVMLSLSGSTQEDDQNLQVEFDRLLEGAIQPDALEHEEAVNSLLQADIPVDESEDIQINAIMFSGEAPAIEEEEEEDDEEEAVNMPIMTLPEANTLPSAVVAIPLAVLQGMTECFDAKYLIAIGGSVFHGVNQFGQRLAIKIPHNKIPEQEFLAQVSVISSLNHNNVVKLLGFCADYGWQIYVSEFAPKWSLHDWSLHDNFNRLLSWAQRMKIAVGAAEGLCYIHEKGLIHHNIKSSNVLIFDDGTAKITDLHLSTQCSCKAFLRGRGYNYPSCTRCHPPEFESHGCSNDQAGDVHSFGILLLQLLTGHHHEFNRTIPFVQNIVNWATSFLSEDTVYMIVDKQLQVGGYPPLAVQKVAAVAAACLKMEAYSRPGMATVLNDLRKASWETQVYLKKRHEQ